MTKLKDNNKNKYSGEINMGNISEIALIASVIITQIVIIKKLSDLKRRLESIEDQQKEPVKMEPVIKSKINDVIKGQQMQFEIQRDSNTKIEDISKVVRVAVKEELRNMAFPLWVNLK